MGEPAPRYSFVPPNFERPLDVEEYLDRVPPGASVKGMYFRSLYVGRAANAPDRNRYVPFRSYSMVEWMQRAVEIAHLNHPGGSSREGLRRLGWAAYQTFATSMVGRVVLGIFDNDLDLIFAAGPKAYSISIAPTVLKSEKLSPSHHRYYYTDCFNFVDSYHVGVVEGTIRHHGCLPDVRVDMTSATDATFDIRWR